MPDRSTSASSDLLEGKVGGGFTGGQGCTWLGACGSSRRDVRVAGSYSSLTLLEHLSGVDCPLRDERGCFLDGKQNGKKL